ncbi:MAG: UDP-2,4-diacetamido-2,4,6-trideoxy-beta-L-altropyranose hydrolase [Methanoregula sp.]|nr:MAG: UDP-2,4-diacetamido-2,4,6-trideoxy-beta-L-altropyranose hydrolase [Methanoregula sp.]
MSNLIIRADASTAIGTGHVMRCLAVAQGWQEQGGKVTFVMAGTTPSAEESINADGMDIIYHSTKAGSHEDAYKTGKIAEQNGAEWVVVDGYLFDAEFQRLLKDNGLKILFIDDFGHADYYSADLVLNQNIYANDTYYKKRAVYTKLILGTQFALIRKEFLKWKNWHRRIPRIAKKILVSLGGSDPENVTSMVLDALGSVTVNGIEVKVIVAKNNPNNQKMQQKIISSHFTGDLIVNARDMPELMSWADLAISAGGSTNLELAFMGLPGITINHAQNQVLNSEILDQFGVIKNLGWFEKLKPDDISLALMDVIKSEDLRKQMAEKGRILVDGGGSKRVIECITGERNAS